MQCELRLSCLFILTPVMCGGCMSVHLHMCAMCVCALCVCLGECVRASQPAVFGSIRIFSHFIMQSDGREQANRLKDWQTQKTDRHTDIQTDRQCNRQTGRDASAAVQRASACHSVSRQFSHCRFPFRSGIDNFSLPYTNLYLYYKLKEKRPKENSVVQHKTVSLPCFRPCSRGKAGVGAV